MDVAGPTAVKGIDDAVQLAAQDFGFCARRASGEVHCWGNWDDGKLGDGAETPAWVEGKQSGRPTPGPVKTGPGAALTGAVDLWAATSSWCARTADAMWCWPSGYPQAAFPDLLLPPCRDDDVACKRFAQRIAGPDVHRYFSMSLRACALSNGRAWCSEDGQTLARAMLAPTEP
jgi:hypothetical protein